MPAPRSLAVPAAGVAAAWLVAATVSAFADVAEPAPGWLLVLNLVVLAPLAVAAAWWIGSALGGPVLGAWFAALLVLVPVAGAPYALTSFRDTYVDVVLPSAVGLADDGLYAAGCLLLVAAALVLAALTDSHRAWTLAAAAGATAGAAALVEPSASLFAVGPLLALAVARRPREAGAFALASAPFLVAAALRADAIGVELSWDAFKGNMAQLREYTWSNRLLQWLPVAGAIGVARRSLPAAALLGGWFGAFALAQGASPNLSVEDGSFMLAFVPALPAFALLVAAVPLLVPTLPRRLPGMAGVLRPR